MEIKTSRRVSRLLITCILIGLFSTIVFAQNYPKPTDDFYVNDYAGIIDAQTRNQIIATGRALNRDTTSQVVVVTVSDLGNEALEEYSLGLFREWGIGDAKKNNGVLIFIDMGGRKSRIDVGYGLEGALPDGKTGRIQDTYMIPYFQEDNYSKGILEGYNAIVSEIYLEYGYEDRVIGNYTPIDQQVPNQEIPPIFIFIGGIILVIVIILDFKFTGGVFTYMIIRSIGRGGSGGGSGRTRGGGGSAGGGGSSRGW